MSVDPCIGDLLLINLSCRKICLSKLAVYCISVDINVIELIILSYALCLIVILLNRSIVVDSDIAYCLVIVRNDVSCQGIVCRIWFNSYVIKSVSISCILDVVV